MIGEFVVAKVNVGGCKVGDAYKVSNVEKLPIDEGSRYSFEGMVGTYSSSYFEPIKKEAPSPIRTSREIVPGVYGPIEVGGVNGNGRIYLRVVGDAYKADDIRELIHIASQVLEVLEENAG